LVCKPHNRAVLALKEEYSKEYPHIHAGKMKFPAAERRGINPVSSCPAEALTLSLPKGYARRD